MKLLKFFEFVQEWDDASIVKGIKNKDHKAENYFYEKFSKLLYLHIKRASPKLDNDTINIIVNNSIMRCINKINLFDSIGSLEGWVRRIGSNCLVDYIKSNQKNSNVFYKGDDPDSQIYQGEYSDILKQMKFKYEIFKKNLSPMQRKVIDMYLNGYKHKEIANELGISIGTSKWHVNDIINTFKKWYNKNKNI